MAISIQRAANRIKDGLINDPDGQYTGDMLQPEDADELDALCYYVARGVLAEIVDHAEIEAGILVEDQDQNVIGETRQTPEGQIE